MNQQELLDCLIIGGGAAGLTAAVYLGRYRRRALVLDCGGSRLRKIPRTRNVPGFPDGIEGPALLQRMQEHARKYGVPTTATEVQRIERLADGTFRAESADARWHARFVLLATGARDVEPEIDGLHAAMQAGQVRYCPVCDGFETQGQRVAVLGRAGHGLRESLFISGFGNQVTWLSMATQEEVGLQELAQLRECGVRLAESPPHRIECGVEGCGVRVELQSGQVLEFDTLYPALGLHHACDLATALGARSRPDGQLEVDAHQQTTVDGLYAAGDVAMDLNQISVAAGHAAIASTAIHNRL
ncbi:NAD(P)/FAD-dependent oxidoreductase [Ramlibacter alkalitolerans]|uniref:NAD(P)/FAD-dependent oxidoreductase n=1 Tax=Ramlibacter alkalitolerans TaxID=2039631 RepID=A0ABS1JJ76_9BURK|nr:NAD(P)/FAD-dependent oxidoreductase [Ramlibacter alkalitolerans]MBL0424277.1 NAD(P)/FAD-dependent oxidoreductase [Ramlibacter alkalitolerans]